MLTPFIGAAVFAAMLIMDPVALGRLGYRCATGGCGVRPVWLAAAAGGVIALVWLLRVVRRPRAAPPAGRTKPSGARRPRGAKRAAAAAKPRPAATRRPRRTS